MPLAEEWQAWWSLPDLLGVWLGWWETAVSHQYRFVIIQIVRRFQTSEVSKTSEVWRST